MNPRGCGLPAILPRPSSAPSASTTTASAAADSAQGNAQQINPFVNLLLETAAGGGGAGATGMLRALLTPSMPRSVASGYESGLEQALVNAVKGYWGQPSPPQSGGEFWRLLMGA